MPFTMIRDDITKLSVHAIVNAANTGLQRGGGVCGAIFKAAGAGELQAACDALAPIRTGEAVMTPGFLLPARYIIHTAGPVYRDGMQGEEALLRACYLNSLALAVEYHCESIAFPLISSGIYGYPKDKALEIAIGAIRDFLSEIDIDVTLVVFDPESFSVSQSLLNAVESYIDRHYVEARQLPKRKLFPLKRKALPTEEAAGQMSRMSRQQAQSIAAPAATLRDLIGNLDESFSAALLRLIDATGRTDAEIYRRANIDRRLFSKIRSNANYAPSKPTVLAFAVALELTLGQTKDLLKRAGFALSPSRKLDVIVEYFIQSRRYDIFEINQMLLYYDQPLLGG